MRNAKSLLIAMLAVLSVLSVLHLAVAAPMAHGRFNGVDAPGFAMPGGRLTFSATAVNDGDSTGWFRICVIRVGPSLNEYFPSKFDEVRDEQAVHCAEVLPVDPGGKVTFTSNIFRMLSVPSVTFWILLAVQQQAPVPVSEGGDDYTNLTIDELREEVVTNFYA